MPETDAPSTRPTAMAPDASTSPVDWSRPIEAVHEDGRVVRAFVDWVRSPDGDGDHWLYVAGEVEPFCAGDDDRRISPIHLGWRIRNVGCSDGPNLDRPTTPERDPALWDRMEALVRSVAQYVPEAFTEVREARAIVADLPKQVDPDEEEAIRLATEIKCGGPSVALALAAIKRGRQLAGEQA